MGKAGEKAAKPPNRLLPDFKRLGAALQRGWPDVRFRAAGDPDAPHEAGQLRLDCSKAQSLLRWHGVWDAETSFRRTSEW